MLLRKRKEMVKKIKKNHGLDECHPANIQGNETIEKSETEWREELEALKPAVRQKLTEVCGKWVHDWWIDAQCENILDGMPKELYQNVWEWIRDEPLSEIIVGKLSIKQIMESNKIDFINGAKLMMKYVRWGCTDETFILMYQALLRS